MRVVVIYEKATGQVVSEYPVTFGIAGEQTTEQDFFDEAWKNAIEDGLVKDDERDNYAIKIAI